MTLTTPPVRKEGLRAWLAARRQNRSSITELSDRSIVSDSERRRPGTWFAMRVVHVFLFVTLVVAGLGPILWLLKAAVTPSQDTITQPFALWPNGIDWANLSSAWNDIHIDQFFFNTIVIAAGAGSSSCSSQRRRAMRSRSCARPTPRF